MDPVGGGAAVVDFLSGMGGPGIIILVLLWVIYALAKRVVFVQDRELTDSRMAIKDTSDALRDNSRALDALAASVKGGRNA